MDTAFADASLRRCPRASPVRQQITRDYMTNASLLNRFGVNKKNYPVVSRVIRDTKEEGLIKDRDPNNKSKKHAKYVPYWA